MSVLDTIDKNNMNTSSSVSLGTINNESDEIIRNTDDLLSSDDDSEVTDALVEPVVPQLDPLSLEAFFEQVRALTWRLPSHINVTWRRDGSLLIPPSDPNWVAPSDNTSDGVDHSSATSQGVSRRHHSKKHPRLVKKVKYYYK
ncbi:hypothetical protein WA158_006935 [Blastocystis sp. Blastoise]